eukprot:CAMPEP_0174828198 /NCGR_PEP_ID=MMETSP1114-20130205/1192_1 /TAXON_ID=312471 /ORGANISM="Neobodo designis, Strain CCAP 1951/1" /LENGTH=341 /DNA_ID=CAMNT_0016061909 /DNA_START=199 /DNA_END=1224 /DNA_ORIENTATION=-
MSDGNKRGLTIERQSSDFVLGDGGRQESVLEPGFVRAPRDMKPPTPVEWGRGDSLMWETGGKQADIDKSTPLAGYGRDKDLFADAVSAISPTQNGPSDPFGGPPSSHNTGHPGPAAAGVRTTGSDAAATFAAVLSGRAHLPADATEPSSRQGQQQQQQQRPPNRLHPAGPGAVGPGRAPMLPSALDPEPQALTRQRTSEAELAAQFRTQSQVLTDELHQQAKTFPPPPPIIAPQEQRRYRAARWYYYATKWDITHEQAPPPRSPLPLMDQETEARNNGTRGRHESPNYPYRGEYWLKRCEHWFSHVQGHFSYPGYASRDTVSNIASDIVLEHAYLGDGAEK